MSRRAAIAFAWIGGLALFVLHLDFWRTWRPTLYLGFIPEELLYRVVWMVLAALYLAWFCGRFFVGDDEAES